jgi:hypothetical protein
MISVKKLLFVGAIGIGAVAPERVAMGDPIFEGHLVAYR